jgi:hypothetical protein
MADGMFGDHKRAIVCRYLSKQSFDGKKEGGGRRRERR